MFFRLLGRLFFYFVNIMGCSSLVIKKKNLLEKLLGGSVTFTEPNNTFYDIIMRGSTIIRLPAIRLVAGKLIAAARLFVLA